MIITKLEPSQAEDLKVQFTLQGLSQIGKQKYETIRILLPETRPLIIDDNLTIADSELWVATGNSDTILFNDFVYIHGLPEQDVLGLINSYDVENVGICHMNRFYYGKTYNDFVSSPMFEHIWLYTSPIDENEEEIYDYE